uniref:Uncharacterized protein n=1 Tax=Solanum lycopersicum TaxID=4081 RepID=A0A3Q7IJ13_SOLLC
MNEGKQVQWLSLWQFSTDFANLTNPLDVGCECARKEFLQIHTHKPIKELHLPNNTQRASLHFYG